MSKTAIAAFDLDGTLCTGTESAYKYGLPYSARAVLGENVTIPEINGIGRETFFNDLLTENEREGISDEEKEELWQEFLKHTVEHFFQYFEQAIQSGDIKAREAAIAMLWEMHNANPPVPVCVVTNAFGYRVVPLMAMIADAYIEYDEIRRNELNLPPRNPALTRDDFVSSGGVIKFILCADGLIENLTTEDYERTRGFGVYQGIDGDKPPQGFSSWDDLKFLQPPPFKPDGYLYRFAQSLMAEHLGVEPEALQGVGFEDSNTGLRALVDAGLVAIDMPDRIVDKDMRIEGGHYFIQGPYEYGRTEDITPFIRILEEIFEGQELGSAYLQRHFIAPVGPGLT